MSVYLRQLSREVRFKKRFQNEHRQVDRKLQVIKNDQRGSLGGAVS